MSKLLSVILVAALFSLVFAGCGGKIEESYQMVTLREAGHSNIISPGFKFGFDTPKFIAVQGNVGMVREGNLIEFFTGQDLENKLKRVEGKRFVAGVRKVYSPRVHFTVDFLAMGNDTIKVGDPSSAGFPTLIKGFDKGQFEEVEFGNIDSSTQTLKDIYDTKFKVDQAKVAYEDYQNARGETVKGYIVTLPRVKFILEQMDPGMELILKALINENHYLKGGLAYGGMPSDSEFPRSYRERTKIGGKVKLEYIEYADQVCPVVNE